MYEGKKTVSIILIAILIFSGYSFILPGKTDGLSKSINGNRGLEVKDAIGFVPPYTMTMEGQQEILIDDVICEPGSTIIASLRLANISSPGCDTVHVNISFDPGVIHVLQVTGSSGFAAWGKTIDNTMGFMNILLSASVPQTGNFTCAFINLSAEGNPAESSPLDIEIEVVGHSLHGSIPVIPVNGTFTIGDTVPPSISNIDASPDPQETGEHVNITCDVTDNGVVDTVMVNITYPDSTTLETPMDDGSYHHNSTYSQLGEYTYHIWANDTSGNTAASGAYTFTIQDTTPPVITDVTDNPDPQEAGGFINITCVVTDASSLNITQVYVTHPDETTSHHCMANIPGTDTWHLNQTYNQPGEHIYLIYAQDTEGNSDSSHGHGFTIIDTQPPAISAVQASPDPQETGEHVNITCDVTDNGVVDTVMVNITYPDSTTLETPMDDGSYHHNSTYSQLGEYTYHIWANDTSGNTAASGTYLFTIGDTTGPVISNVADTPDPQETGGYVNITCDVTDNVAVDTVTVEIRYPDSSVTNTTMDMGGYWHNGTYSLIGIYEYFIWANDTSGNLERSIEHTFTIQDTTPPAIANISDSPDPQEAGGHVNITCDVTDNIMVDTVMIMIYYPDTLPEYIEMTNGYWHNATYGQVGTHSYCIQANDTSGNMETSATYTFAIQDTMPPVITSITDTPDPQYEDGYVNITCSVTDNAGVDTVLVNITYPDSTILEIPMDEGSYHYNATYSQAGIYTYHIRANDTSGNTETSPAYTFTIESIDDTPPVLSGVSSTLAVIPLDTADKPGYGPQDDDTIYSEYVNITIDVTDESNISSVLIDLSLLGGNPMSPMAHATGTDTWYARTNASLMSSWNGTTHIYDTFSLVITATDEHDNWDTSSVQMEVWENGDIDGDGGLSAYDVTYLANHIIGSGGYTIPHKNVADVDCDGRISVYDITRLANNIVGNPGYGELY